MTPKILVLICLTLALSPALHCFAQAETLAGAATISATKTHPIAKPEFKTMHVADLVTALAHDKTVSIYDANGDDTRGHAGLIRGAHVLSSYDKFAASELPADKKAPVVFYCANTMCTASHDAATHAISLGYSNVSVMVDGIYGWKKAGQPTDKFKASRPPETALKAPNVPNANEISPLDAKKLVDAKKAIILDVRETEERHEVVPTAQSLPLSTDGTPAWNDFVAKLDKSKTIVVHCAMGVRAKKVADELAQQGFRTSFFKGPEQWKEAGLKLDAGPAL